MIEEGASPGLKPMVNFVFTKSVSWPQQYTLWNAPHPLDTRERIHFGRIDESGFYPSFAHWYYNLSRSIEKLQRRQP
jgi:hypothetical protein